MPETIPILFDTDIGSDIDDAVALAYLLAQPRCELVGTTTVTGGVAQRAALVQVLCEAAGKPDTPIHCGAGTVLLDGPGQPDVPQYAAIESRPHRLDFPGATAIGFMRDLIRSRPGEITLLSVGPLTNVALLFSLDTELPSLLRSWVSMAGQFFGDWDIDWNSVCDPLATAIAFRHRPPERVHVGLDVTLKSRMNAATVRQRFRGPVLGVVAEMAEVWLAGRDHITFHDPLAAALVFQPGLCELQPGEVIADSGGRTSFRADANGPDRVAIEVDVDAFFAEYFSAFPG
jgi:purine nucleosidase